MSTNITNNRQKKTDIQNDDIQNSPTRPLDGPTWRNQSGEPLSCTEKIKVLNDNLAEIKQLSQDALEDAILMGCDERQFRQVMADLVSSLKNPYADQ